MGRHGFSQADLNYLNIFSFFEFQKAKYEISYNWLRDYRTEVF